MLEVNKTLTKECQYLTFVLDSICNSSDSATSSPSSTSHSSTSSSDDAFFREICIALVCLGLLAFCLSRIYRETHRTDFVQDGHGSKFGSRRKVREETKPLPSLELVEIVSFGGPIRVTYRNGKTEVFRGVGGQPTLLYPLGIQQRRKIGQAIPAEKPIEKVKQLQELYV